MQIADPNRASELLNSIEFAGERKPLSAWAEQLGISWVTLRARLDMGWPLERALSPGKFNRAGKCMPNRKTTTEPRVVVLPDAASMGAAGAGGAMDTMAWALAAAGVPSLIVGRWPADGFTTDALMMGFHSALAKGATIGEAWRSAVAAARATGRAPSGWAGARRIGF